MVVAVVLQILLELALTAGEMVRRKTLPPPRLLVLQTLVAVAVVAIGL